MIHLRHEQIRITPHFTQLGTPDFPTYLSMGRDGMLIEGGTGATFPIMVDQLRSLAIDPERIRYIVLTHSHPDHIGAVPHFQALWPHIKLLASPIIGQVLNRTELFREFLLTDLGIAQLMKARGEIDALPEPVEEYVFKVDSTVQENDRIDLGEGIAWTIYETPGHSPCHISLLEEKEGILAIGDSTGFCVPEKATIWPNYFNSLEKYCDSIRKLSTLNAKRGALSHNGMIRGDLGDYLTHAMKATEAYHNAIQERIGRGEEIGEIALDHARFVDSLTDIQPFKVMYDLCKVLIKNSQKNGSPDHFIM